MRRRILTHLCIAGNCSFSGGRGGGGDCSGDILRRFSSFEIFFHLNSHISETRAGRRVKVYIFGKLSSREIQSSVHNVSRD